MERKSGETVGEEKRGPKVLWTVSLVVRDENNEEVTPYILEGTRLNGCSYILAVDNEEVDEDDTCYFLKNVSSVDGVEATYEFAGNKEEAGYMLEIFQTISEDEDADIDSLDE